MKKAYLNQAGTTWPKPPPVSQACAEAFEADMDTWNASFEANHQELASYFGIPSPKSLLLTPGCTSALNVAISDHDWREGDVVLTSAFEHHAMHRPLVKLTHQDVDLQVIPPSTGTPFNLEKAEQILKRGRVKMIAVTAASNVTGDLLPLAEIQTLAQRYEAILLVDGAQLVGWFDLNLARSGYDLFAFGGHKGLHGPWGIGGLYINPNLPMSAPQASCSVEAGPAHCTSQPSYCDVGSVDRIALAGVVSAINWLDATHCSERLERARTQAERIRQSLDSVSGIRIYGSPRREERLPIVAFDHRDHLIAELATKLREQGVEAAAGLQCAPMAHDILGTSPAGVLRLSVGPMNSDEDIEIACRAIRSLTA